MTPNELHRTLASLASRSKPNQSFFMGINSAHYNKSVAEGNASYVVQQAKDWLKTEEMGRGGDPAFLAHARSDMARILALVHRQAIARGIDLIELLSEGVEYEEAVVADIKAGRRQERSHKGLGGS